MSPALRYIYGPVVSWRLGSSLGIDLLSGKEKVCDFDCAYCQLGRTKKYTVARKVYVPVKKIVVEVKRLPACRIDYITFSGRGEPCLAANLGAAIKAVKKIRTEPVAVLTNASLLRHDRVRKELDGADFVCAKLDAHSPESLRRMNNPAAGISFPDIARGIKKFSKGFRGKLALQIMFTRENRPAARRYIPLINSIRPEEVQVNTPLRPSAANPLAKKDVLRIKEIFRRACPGAQIVSVFDRKPPRDIVSLSGKDTLRRRGKPV